MTRPVHLVPTAQAVAGRVAHDLPVFDAAKCQGCRFTPICKARGAVASLEVVERVGPNLECRLSPGGLVACRVDNVKLATGLVRREAAPAKEVWFLADASVFINAGRWKWDSCIAVLEAAGVRFNLATTRAVHAELHHSYRLPMDLAVIDVPVIDEDLVELSKKNRTADGGQASLQDLSLVQAALNDARFAGILTEDSVLAALHPTSYIQERKGRRVEVLTCAQFAQAHAALLR